MDWLRRRWFDLALLVGLVIATVAAIDWRQQQFEGHGLRGAYYARADWKGRPFMTRVDPFIDFSDADDPIYERTRFTVEWTGTLVAPRAGLYRFALESDDGSTLEIDGQAYVPPRLGQHGLRFTSIHLRRKQRFTATYYRGTGDAPPPIPRHAGPH